MNSEYHFQQTYHFHHFQAFVNQFSLPLSLRANLSPSGLSESQSTSLFFRASCSIQQLPPSSVHLHLASIPTSRVVEMAPTTRKQRETALRTGQALSPLVQITTPPPRRRRPVAVSPVTPEAMDIYHGGDRTNAFMGAPFPEDNSDIPAFDLGEPLDELSLWERQCVEGAL